MGKLDPQPNKPVLYTVAFGREYSRFFYIDFPQGQLPATVAPCYSASGPFDTPEYGGDLLPQPSSRLEAVVDPTLAT